MVTARCGLDSVGGYSDVAVSAVLEANRSRQARGQLAVHLALGGARPDRAPGNQVAQVLRRDHVQKLATRGKAQAVDFDQQLPCHAQAFVNAEALIQVGVVDQALPTHGGAGLLEIHAHHDFQCVGIAATLLHQAVRVFHGGGRVMDGTGPDHDQQSVIFARHDLLDAAAGVGDQGLDGRATDGEEADQVFGRR